MTQSTSNGEPVDPATAQGDDERIVIVGPDGRPVGVLPAERVRDESAEGSVADLVEQPAKVMRIGSMIKQLLEEVRSAPLDEASRTRLRDIHRRSIAELEQGLAPELVDELERLTLPFTDDRVPSESELRIAQAQLVGWLEGLFHGIQTALFAQQMAAQAQFEQMRRRAISGPGQGDSGVPGVPGPNEGGNGLYL
ncbi:MAG TPA: bacterial proteasome activator family protein [Candidatus Nanopelagicales bacterium]